MSDAFDPYYKWLGIPPSEQPPDHYRLLGIALYESDPEVIAHAADQRMAHLKNFQAGQHSVTSQRLLNQIAAAKLVLLSPRQKETYDRQLPRRKRAAESSLAGFLHLGRAFWERAAVVAMAIVLLIATVTFLRARNESQDALTAEHGPATIPDAKAVAELPQPAHPRRLNTAPAAPASTGAKTAPVLPAAGGPDETGPRGRGHPAADASPAIDAGGKEQVGAPVANADAGADDRRGKKHHGPVDPAGPPHQEAPPLPPSVYLDDLKEMDFRVACGSLGKRGVTGYLKQELEYGQRVVFRERVCDHALSVHPPSRGASYVVYNLNREYRSFRVTAAVLGLDQANAGRLEANPLFMGKAYTPLTFKIFGDGKLLWQSRQIQRSGDFQDCSLRVEGISLLELQVDCPGTNAFAWAAWIDPKLSR